MPDSQSAVSGRTVLIAGATSAAGVAAARTLAAAGARVVAVGSNAGRLELLRDAVPEAALHACDLSSWPAVLDLVQAVHAEHGSIDGLLHLVGGWRGGGGLAGQSDEDWEFLHERVLTTLRHTTRAFNNDLLASTAARAAIVSSVTVDAPAPGGANYAAAKAAAETWMRAVGRGFATAESAAASVVFVVKALDGLEGELAARFAGLWDVDAASVNNSRILLG